MYLAPLAVPGCLLVFIATVRLSGFVSLGSLLGSGGVGEVYRGKDVRLGRPVAIKVLRPESASSPERLARFEADDLAAWKAATRKNTTAFFMETPTNPTLEVYDIAAVADIAHMIVKPIEFCYLVALPI